MDLAMAGKQTCGSMIEYAQPGCKGCIDFGDMHQLRRPDSFDGRIPLAIGYPRVA